MPETIDFSIIIPTRDRPAQLAVCLGGVAEIDYPRSRFEVIVVDDGSKRPLEEIVSRHSERLQITLCTQAGGGPARARNHGATKARGRLLAFTDDDCVPAPDWLRKLEAQYEEHPGHVIGGRTVNALTGNLYSAASQVLIAYLYDYFNAGEEKIWFLASCNLAIPSEAYRSVGGFDSGFPRPAAEDRDFCDRLRLQGYSMSYAADAVVNHRHTLAPATFWRQHFEYGRGAHRFRRAHRGRSGRSIRLEPFGFYSGMMLYPFRRGGGGRPVRLAALLALSQAANASGFLWEWLVRSVRRGGPSAEAGP